MNLLFNEYIQFLKDNGLQKYLDLKEGYYWLDNQIIKAFDKQGNLHKVLRVCVDNDLNISFKTYKEEKFEIESWYETAERNKDRLNTLENNSLKLIDEAISLYPERLYAVPYSTGKDSGLTLHLIKKKISGPIVIFNNTTIDVADTYIHAKSIKNVRIITPKEGFYIWRKRIGFVPTRFGRACCTIYKEQAMIDNLNKNDKYLFFMGMRNEESITRSEYNNYWRNTKWGTRDWNACLPIGEWSEVDVWLYALLNNIEINTKYKKGYSRVGCAVVCPYYSKSTWVLDKYWYPFLYKRWHEILDDDFITNKKACTLNCTNKEYHSCWSGGVYRDTAPEEVIEEFSRQQDLSLELSRKYFNKTCTCCNKRLKKDDIALSIKYNGRITETFKCKMCLAKDLGIKTKELIKKIQEFKSDGCDLF